jgi:hypothetical protein
MNIQEINAAVEAKTAEFRAITSTASRAVVAGLTAGKSIDEVRESLRPQISGMYQIIAQILHLTAEAYTLRAADPYAEQPAPPGSSPFMGVQVPEFFPEGL